MCHPIRLPSRKYGTVWYHLASSKLWYLTTLSFVNFQGKLTGTSCDSLHVWSQLVRLAVCLALGARFASTLPRYYKWDVVKTRQPSHGLTDTRQKGHWKIMLCQGGGEKNTHTLRQVDICKWQWVIPRHKGSPRYRIAHGWKNDFGS
jgi:hypothetical protein